MDHRRRKWSSMQRRESSTMAAEPSRSFTVVGSRDLRYLVRAANFCYLTEGLSPHRLSPPAVHLVETRARLSVQVPERRHCQRTLTGTKTYQPGNTGRLGA
jgi:hypothetical protein